MSTVLSAFSFDNTLGALLVGGLISGMCVPSSLPSLVSAAFSPAYYLLSSAAYRLYGITCTQTYVYYERSAGDRPSLKAFVRLFSFFPCHLPSHHLFCNISVHSPRVLLNSRLRWTNADLFSLLHRSPSYGSRPPSLAPPVPWSDARFASILPRAPCIVAPRAQAA